MKIKVEDKPYAHVAALAPAAHVQPRSTSRFWRGLVKLICQSELRKVHFRMDWNGCRELYLSQPCLILMNHSSSIDLNIVFSVLASRPFHTVTTRDAFVGKAGLLRRIGCIPTAKFVSDLNLVRDLRFCTQQLRESVLMFPEASYSFDGSQTPLPASLGKCLKLLDVPVIMFRSSGAFLRDPLYNKLQKRHADVSVKAELLLTPDQIKSLSVDKLNQILASAFSYDHFREQHETATVIDEPFRADGLQRALYKCCCCGAEGVTRGEGTTLSCTNCGSVFELHQHGSLVPLKLASSDPAGNPATPAPAATATAALVAPEAFSYVSDWYAWERQCVRQELEQGSYLLQTPVDIIMLKDFHAVYRVGSGILRHSIDGFTLDGCYGALHYEQRPEASYSLYADYYWYELGDVISIGTTECQYYCFPQDQEHAIVAKARLAAEEAFKLKTAAPAQSLPL